MAEQQQTLIQQLWERRQGLYWIANELGAGPCPSGLKQQIRDQEPNAVEPETHVDKAVQRSIDAVEATILSSPPETVQDALLQLSLAGLKREVDDEEMIALAEMGHDGALAFLGHELQCNVDTMRQRSDLEIIGECLRLARSYGYEEPEQMAEAA